MLTTHVGSLPRGDDLASLLLARDQGKAFDVAELERRIQTAMDEAVDQQLQAGISIVSDGELGKVGYSTYVTERLSGFGGNVRRQPAADLANLPELRRKLAVVMGEQEFVRASCVGPVRLINPGPCREDVRRLRQAIGGRTTQAFMNAASPGLIAAFQSNTFYPSHDAYLADLVSAMRPEYETIAASGLQLQLDCPDLAMSRHTAFQDLSEESFLSMAAAHIEALNAATANIAPQQMRMHVCWGNYEGPHDCDIPLERIIQLILKARPATILFEAANPRHEHEWKVWANTKIPEDKLLAPGLIDSCTNYVEHPELVAQRIERYTSLVGRERVIASTDCGFGTFAGYGKIDPAVTWKKLRALRAGADIASGREFPG